MKFAIAFIVAAVLLTGCGDPNQAATVQTPAPEPKTARQVAMAVKADIKTVSEVIIWTEDNDPNKLLGRPNQYTSSASLTDDRILLLLSKDPDFPATSCSRSNPGVQCGATIEVFATGEDAAARATRIGDLEKAAPWLGLEYLTVEGRVLLRVTGALTPTVNREYVAAFRKALTL